MTVALCLLHIIFYINNMDYEVSTNNEMNLFLWKSRDVVQYKVSILSLFG